MQCGKTNQLKQSVALKKSNTTGPPSRTVPRWVTLHMRALQTTDDDRPLLVWASTRWPAIIN